MYLTMEDVDVPVDLLIVTPDQLKKNVSVGDITTVYNSSKEYFPAKIINPNATNVTIDLNSQLAGQTLTFDVTLVNLTPTKVVEAIITQYTNETA